MARALLCVVVAAALVCHAAAACTVTFSAASMTALSLDLQGCSGGNVVISHVNGSAANSVIVGTDSASFTAATTPTNGVFDFSLLRAQPNIFQHGRYFAFYMVDANVQNVFGPFDTACSDAGRADGYSPPTLQMNTSKLTRNEQNVPALQLEFKADKADNSVAFEFLYQKSRGASRCAVDFNYGTAKNVRNADMNATNQADGAAGNGAWTMNDASATTCRLGVTYRYNVNDFNKALANCGWETTETVSVTVFSTTVLKTSLQQGRAIRNVLVTRSLESSVTVLIEIITKLTATVGPLRIFGPRIEYSTLEKQVFNPYDSCASWGLQTSVQGPYQLYPKTGVQGVNVGSSVVATPYTGITSSSFKAMSSANADALLMTNTNLGVDAANRHVSGTVSLDLAKCLVQGSQDVVDYSDPTGTYAPCTQRWFLSACKPCTSEEANVTANLNLAWTAHFTVTCHNSFNGSCATPQDPSVEISWNTYSDNYCPRIIDTEASSAVLKVYQESDFSVEQSQFVFGTKSYFEATATSSINIEDLEAERILLTEGGKTGANQVVFQRTAFTGLPAWWATSNASALADGIKLNTVELALAKNVAVGTNPLQRKVQFSWLWNSDISAATGDFPTTTTVQIDLRVRYANQNTPKRGLDVLSVRFEPHLAAVDAVASAQTNVGVIGRSTATGAAPTSGASSPAAMSAQTITIGVAVVGGVALVAVGVAVARRRSTVARSTAVNMESVEMRGSPTTNVV